MVTGDNSYYNLRSVVNTMDSSVPADRPQDQDQGQRHKVRSWHIHALCSISAVFKKLHSGWHKHVWRNSNETTRLARRRFQTQKTQARAGKKCWGALLPHHSDMHAVAPYKCMHVHIPGGPLCKNQWASSTFGLAIIKQRIKLLLPPQPVTTTHPH